MLCYYGQPGCQHHQYIFFTIVFHLFIDISATFGMPAIFGKSLIVEMLDILITRNYHNFEPQISRDHKTGGPSTRNLIYEVKNLWNSAEIWGFEENNKNKNKTGKQTDGQLSDSYEDVSHL